jgi:integrase/recombinase XerD
VQVLDQATEIPPMDVLSRRYRRITPHLYPPAEIAATLKEAGELSPPLRAATDHCWARACEAVLLLHVP